MYVIFILWLLFLLSFPLQSCWKVYNTGSFEVVEGKEIYCTLCGDGGEIISCDQHSCPSSFCQSCIRRIAGERYLQKLVEDETVVWKCFCCDTGPLMHYRSLCSRLCEYYARDKQNKKSFVRGKVRLSSDTDSDCVARGVSGLGEAVAGVGDGVMVEEVKGGVVGGRGEGVGGESTSSNGERGNRTRGEEEKRERGQEGGRDGVGGRGSSQREGRGGGGGGGGDKKRPNKKRREMDTSDSEVDSSSCDGEDSPKVDTDDVSISDSSLFEGDISSLKRAGPSSKTRAQPQTKTTTRPEREGGAKRLSRSPSATGSQERKMKKKKTKMSSGDSAHRMVLSSDSGSDFESVPKKLSPRRRVVSSSSSTSHDSSKRGGEKREKKVKKSVLLDILSSGSEEGEPLQKLSVKRPPNEAGYDLDSDPQSPALSPPSERPNSPVVYATPRKLNISSDSDDELVVLERRQKKSHVLGSDSSSVHGDEQPVSTKSETAAEKIEKKKKKVQRGKRKKGGNSSGDDFDARDMQVRGPKLKRRRVARAIMSDSDSSDSGTEEEEEGSGDEEEEEEGEKSTPGRKRKKIRRLMTDAKLQSTTKEAQRAERERIERLKKRQSMGKENDELILEEDPATKKVN